MEIVTNGWRIISRGGARATGRVGWATRRDGTTRKLGSTTSQELRQWRCRDPGSSRMHAADGAIRGVRKTRPEQGARRQAPPIRQLALHEAERQDECMAPNTLTELLKLPPGERRRRLPSSIAGLLSTRPIRAAPDPGTRLRRTFANGGDAPNQAPRPTAHARINRHATAADRRD